MRTAVVSHLSCSTHEVKSQVRAEDPLMFENMIVATDFRLRVTAVEIFRMSMEMEHDWADAPWKTLRS